MALPDDVISNITNTLRSPPGTFEVSVHDKTFATESFTQTESDLFATQFNSLIAGLDSSQVQQILASRSDTIAQAATYAKKELDGKVFGGINAGDNEVGFSILRPGQIRADPATGDAENDWYYDPSGTGWQNWIGNDGANDYSMTEDQVNVVFGFMDQDVDTPVSGLNVETFGRNMDMLPQDLNDMRLRDNDTEQQVQELPTLIASDNDDIHCRLRYDRDVESQPRFLGVSFGLGAFLNEEDY